MNFSTQNDDFIELLNQSFSNIGLRNSVNYLELDFISFL